MRMSFICTMFCAIACAPLISAQTSSNKDSADAPTFKASTEQVLLDVVVRDKKGHVVRDLKPGDFEVVDGGQRREIKSLRLVEGRESVDAASGVKNQLDPMRQIRLVTLIFHGLDQNGQVLARQAALELTKSDLAQNVYMSVFAIDHTLEAIQSFTNDRELLRKAILRATSGAHDYADDSATTAHQLEQMAGPMQGGGTSIDDRVGGMSNGASGSSGASGAPQGASAANAAMAQIMLGILHASQEDATTDVARGTIYSLLDAVKEQFRLPGRKTVILFSSGFTKPQSAEEQFQSIISMANRSNVSFYTVDTHGLSTTSTNMSALAGLSSAASSSRANATSRSGVTTGMAESADTALDAGRKDTQLNLEILAKETGGELIANTNDFRGPLRKVQEDIETYYELAYSPEIQKYDGSFRKVSVKATVPNLRVQAPSGYFAIPPSMGANGQALAPFEVPLLKALDQPSIPHDFAFHSAGMHYEGQANSPTCEVVIDVPISNLTLQKREPAGPYEGKFAYVALIKDAQGNLLKKFRNEIPLTISEDKLQAYKAGHFVYAEPFPLKPGRYVLQAAVMDIEGNKLAARKSSFMVPAQTAALSISSVAIVRNMQPAEPNGTTTDPMMVDHQIVTPSLSPSLKKSEVTGLPFYVVLYPDKSDSDSTSLEMEFDRDGQLLGKTPAQLGKPDASGHIQYVVTAPLAKFEAGNYQVRFIAKQGTEAAVESTTFTIEP